MSMGNTSPLILLLIVALLIILWMFVCVCLFLFALCECVPVCNLNKNSMLPTTFRIHSATDNNNKQQRRCINCCTRGCLWIPKCIWLCLYVGVYVGLFSKKDSYLLCASVCMGYCDKWKVCPPVCVCVCGSTTNTKRFFCYAMRFHIVSMFSWLWVFGLNKCGCVCVWVRPCLSNAVQIAIASNSHHRIFTSHCLVYSFASLLFYSFFLFLLLCSSLWWT